MRQQQLLRGIRGGSLSFGWARQLLPGRCLRWTAARWNRRPSICARLGCTAGMESGRKRATQRPSPKMEEGPLRARQSSLLRGDLSLNHLRNLIKSLRMFRAALWKRVLRKLRGCRCEADEQRRWRALQHANATNVSGVVEEENGSACASADRVQPAPIFKPVWVEGQPAESSCGQRSHGRSSFLK